MRNRGRRLFIYSEILGVAALLVFVVGGAPSIHRSVSPEAADAPWAAVPGWNDPAGGPGASGGSTTTNSVAAAAGPDRVLRALLYNVPPTIDWRCTRDVTAAIQSWIDSRPNGSTISFRPNACYRTEGSIQVEGRKNLIIEGNGATFRQTTTGDRNRVGWRIKLSENITLRNIKVDGPNTPWAYVTELEGQHGVGVNGSRNVVVSGISVRETYGDCVMVSRGGNGDGSIGSDGVTVRNSTCQNIGRQGMSVTMGRNVVLTGNQLNNVRRTVFDLEPNLPGQYAENVTISNNRVGFYTHFFVGSGGAGCNVRNITVRGNDSDGGGIGIKVAANMTCHKSGFVVEGNTFRMAVGLHWTGWAAFQDTDNVVVRGNRILTDRPMPGVKFQDAGGSLVVEGNHFPGACLAFVTYDMDPSVVSAANNVLNPCPDGPLSR